MKLFKPTYYLDSVFDIDIKKLQKQGFKLAIFDLDNTLVSSNKFKAPARIKKLFNNFKKHNIQVAIVSNNKRARVVKFCSDLNIPYMGLARKPLKTSFKKVIKNFDNLDLTQIIMIGDQILTDIAYANRNKITSILVKPVNPSDDCLPTKINRKIEKKILKKLKKKNELKTQ